MPKLIALLVLLSVSVSSMSQKKSVDSCAQVKAKGYTNNFCDYNNKYSFKNIPFESSLTLVSSKFQLIKHAGGAYQYDCKDDDVLNWATVKFDNCIFDFSATDKLDGVQLQLSESSATSNKDIRDKLNEIMDYLTTYFGKPETFPGSTSPMWRGWKIYIVISNIQDSSGLTVAIYRINMNPIDNL